MIKVEEITKIVRRTNGEIASVKISAFADTKSEVTANAHYEGLPEGASIMFGSSIMTAEGDVGFMKSNGSWNWL